ncbi:MAG: toll/interleukin-1 receptor domain-containing protein, partial [Nitrospirae bacterium]|nr:toll/interleukin-1 receptor domain-containing protein [Nitrospirota bacterium]
SELEPGDEFQNIIHNNIRSASFFISFISNHLTYHKKRFFWKEYNWAKEVYLECKPGEKFLLPLIIDDTPPEADFLEDMMRSKHCTQLDRDGHLSEEFLRFLSEGIKQFRRAK